MQKQVEDYAINVGSILTVHIAIQNLGGSTEHVVVQEVVIDAEPIEPEELVSPVAAEGFIGIRLPYYEWKLDVGAGSTEEITYQIRPLSAGQYILGATRVYAKNSQFMSEPLIVNVLCNQNQVCEPAYSENYENCPADCSSGSEDGMCDLVSDGVCDPDCTVADTDCQIDEGLEKESQKNWVLFTGAMLLMMIPLSGLLLFGALKNRKY